MQLNPLGRTGLHISEIAFGGGDTGRVLVSGDDRMQLALLRSAVASGINWIDTAALYGKGASEAAIGRHLRRSRRGRRSRPRCGSSSTR